MVVENCRVLSSNEFSKKLGFFEEENEIPTWGTIDPNLFKDFGGFD